MEMRFFHITDQVKLVNFNVTWHPGQENLTDYFKKHFDAKHHQVVCPWYLHMHNSPTQLLQALAPCTLKGCVGTLPNGYARSAPLPQLRPDTSAGPRMCGHPSMLSTTHLAMPIHNISALSPQLRDAQKLIHQDPFTPLSSSSLIV